MTNRERLRKMALYDMLILMGECLSFNTGDECCIIDCLIPRSFSENRCQRHGNNCPKCLESYLQEECK